MWAEESRDRVRFAGVMAVVAGGLLMAALWLVFTSAHGPTSFNEDRVILGGSMLFWGMLLGGIPNLLIAAGLVVFSSRLALLTGRLARVGYVLLLIGRVGSCWRSSERASGLPSRGHWCRVRSAT